MTAPLTWDIFCRVIDNHGDIGVCWRLARQLADRGHAPRLWVDDASALAWMAPHGHAGVEVQAWDGDTAFGEAGDVVIEAFGCELDAHYLEAMARRAAAGHAPAWVNLEYLSAEDWVERNHGLRSPVFSGPAAGLDKYFFYPGFTGGTGGLLREDDLEARKRNFDRAAWLLGHGVPWHEGDAVVSLFCYEPAALPRLLMHLGAAGRTHLLVTAGRATQAVKAALHHAAPSMRLPSISWLPAMPQTEFDHLLWASDLNLVRGEDSLVRALWAGKPFVWNIYPQDDAAHHAKLAAFLDWMDAPASLRDFSLAWNGIVNPELAVPDLAGWQVAAKQARLKALALRDLCTQLESFVLRVRMR
ncbi:elongation factor P maturation arginine rhamnosyltransferase EarP [Variovorax sp. VNK109]|uniref:elongation factor P maturation arginine rhamnosyltransferase EarP n=1 Tax=Variovorax sp. VNK109 TaxID=3400919 RepID=UPI003C0F8BE3